MTDLRVAKTRKQAYQAGEMTGESQEALWEALEYLIGNDKQTPTKVKKMLARRQAIKQQYKK